MDVVQAMRAADSGPGLTTEACMEGEGVERWTPYIDPLLWKFGVNGLADRRS
jgi:hypothetical protein